MTPKNLIFLTLTVVGSLTACKDKPAAKPAKINAAGAAQMLNQPISSVTGSWTGMFEPEREVMVLVAAGLLNKPVAHELGISQITVKAYRGSMMRKMNADSLAALVRMADSLRITASQWNWRSSRLTWSAFGARRIL